jgi:hypothetical protein
MQSPGADPLVALDTQCFSYLLDAIAGIEEPTDALAEERKALIRSWFYMPATFYLPQTVIVECERIRLPERRDLHSSFVMTLFLNMPVRHPGNVAVRTHALMQSHSEMNDCRILAETEDLGLKHLLTYDRLLLQRLHPISDTVTIQTPTAYWQSLAIPRGAKPRTVPHHTNPLSQQTWWRW